MPFRHPLDVRSTAVALVRSGHRTVDAAAAVGVSSTTLYGWLHVDAPELVRGSAPCFRCGPDPGLPPRPAAYAHLLGLYLGDGWLHRGPRGVYDLRLYCADAWPGLQAEAAAAARAVSGRSACSAQREGCREVKTYWTHWPCVLPQHGPGKKHERSIALLPWQEEVLADHSGQLLRGLFHSDGWRGTNVAVKHVDGRVVRYRYPRYEFTNVSDDIRRICTDALDRLGIAWRPVGRWRVAVSRRDAVAALDEHVGPKH